MNKRAVGSLSRVELFLGRLSHGSSVVVTGDRGFEILAALALRGELSRDQLIELVWPDLDSQPGANALKMCVYRLRSAAADKAIVESTKTGYRLGPDTTIDVREIEEALAHHATAPPNESEAAHRALERHAADILDASLGRLSRLPWACASVAYLERLRRRVLLVLARVAEERNDLLAFDRLILGLLATDPCDERAHELAICAALRRGRRRKAQRQYDLYRDALSRELDVAEETRLRAVLDVFDAERRVTESLPPRLVSYV